MSHIYLIGYLESGNYTLGRHLSDQINWPFFDTDTAMAKSIGMDLVSFAKEQGNDAYRAKQYDALLEASKLTTPTVINVGDEVPLGDQDWDTMQQTGTTIYIKRTAERLYWRMRHDPNRAGLHTVANKEREAFIADDLAAREPLYLKANHVLDMTIEEVETISAMLVDLLKLA